MPISIYLQKWVTARQKLETIWIVDVILGSINGKLMVYAEYFGLSKFSLFVLFLFKFLKLKVSAEASDNNDFVIVVHNSCVSFGFESALFEFSKFLLPSFLSYFLLFFFKFFFKIFGKFLTLTSAESGWYILIFWWDKLWFESVFLLFFTYVFLLFLFKLLFGCRVTHVFA